MSAESTIPNDALRLLTRVGFLKRYYEVVNPYQTQKWAYEQVESECQEYFKTNPFSSYDCFRMYKWREQQKQSVTFVT